MGKRIPRDDAAKWLSLAIEAIVENYREYRDYNTTTTQSDHGELLYTLVDFLRLRAAYDRVAWNLRPVVMAHEILVRQNRPAAAEMWQQALAERTAETADANLARFEELCNQYGIRLPSVAERLGERFTRPLAIDRVRALVGPADRRRRHRRPRARSPRCKQEIASLAQEPAGAGLDLPDWLAALEEEVSMVRCTPPPPGRRRRAAPNRAGPPQLGRMAAANRGRRGIVCLISAVPTANAASTSARPPTICALARLNVAHSPPYLRGSLPGTCPLRPPY